MKNEQFHHKSDAYCVSHKHDITFSTMKLLFIYFFKP